jgi:hypothetical protein
LAVIMLYSILVTLLEISESKTNSPHSGRPRHSNNSVGESTNGILIAQRVEQ